MQNILQIGTIGICLFMGSQGVVWKLYAEIWFIRAFILISVMKVIFRMCSIYQRFLHMAVLISDEH